MKLEAPLLLVVVVVASALATPELDQHWMLFKKTYMKNYHGVENNNRRKIWEENVKRIQQHNLLYDMGLKTYTVGLNKYMDLSDAEYRQHLLGYRANLNALPGQPTCGRMYVPPGGALPEAVDWRTKGYVTPIKDQAECGSCWAFSATGALEGQHFKKTGQLVSLSEQNLVDCSMKEGNHGCGGGWPQAAFNYIKINGGIDTEASYPYKAKDQNCTFNPATIGATETGCYDIQQGSEMDLAAAVADVGPVSVGIDASGFGFRGYKSGVYNELFCSQDRLDHGVLVVGYGSQDGHDYWIVKNSWGVSWGNKGYILFRRNEYNMCGIASSASFPTV